MELLFQGAEAKLFKFVMFDRPVIVKERFAKQYRHNSMDVLIRLQRTKAEARAMLKAAQLEVAAPALYLMDLKNYTLYMERIDGIVLKDLLAEHIGKNDFSGYINELMELLGTNVARLHMGSLMHGDLTTSNFVVRSHNPGEPLHPQKLVTIDFGLSFISDKAEDKAVDLYVLERALLSTHPDFIDQLFYKGILAGYRQFNPDHAAEVLHKLEEVQLRGRKKLMIG